LRGQQVYLFLVGLKIGTLSFIGVTLRLQGSTDYISRHCIDFGLLDMKKWDLEETDLEGNGAIFRAAREDHDAIGQLK